MFRRPLRRPNRRPMVNRVPPALQRANQLMTNGGYLEAAEIFIQFGNGALMRNGPRAPWFFLQAGQAFLLGGKVSDSIDQIIKGLNIFVERGEDARIFTVGLRIVRDMQSQGYQDEAKRIEEFVRKSLPASFLPGSGISIKMSPVLPTNCPGCGGPIRSDEVEWADDATAECPYCGSSIRAE